MDATRLEYIRKTLVERIKTPNNNITSTEIKGCPQDEYDIANINTAIINAIGTQRIENIILTQMKRAVGKIDEGTYGLCDGCQKDIPEARLEAIPYAIHCIPCQEKTEK